VASLTKWLLILAGIFSSVSVRSNFIACRSTLVVSGLPVASHFTGVFDACTVMDASPTLSSLLQTCLPTCSRVVDEWSSGDYDDWNVGFQECYDAAVRARPNGTNLKTQVSHTSKLHRTDTQASVASLGRSISQMSMVTDTTLATTVGEPSPEQEDTDDMAEMSATLQYAAHYGEFLSAAAEGDY
jgi:hypothetical protein